MRSIESPRIKTSWLRRNLLATTSTTVTSVMRFALVYVIHVYDPGDQERKSADAWPSVADANSPRPIYVGDVYHVFSGEKSFLFRHSYSRSPNGTGADDRLAFRRAGGRNRQLIRDSLH